MSKTMYLYRVKKTYYFRCRIPSDLINMFPLQEVRRSLKTTSLSEQQLGKYYDYLSSYEAQYHYDNIFVQCMTSHGNRILVPVR